MNESDGIKLWATGLWAGGREFDSRQMQETILISTTSTPGRGPTQPPIQRMQRALSPGVKRPGREAHHLPLSSAEVKNDGALICTSHVLH
jgi:hypothetical protein